MQRTFPNHPQGALRQPDGSVVWRVWAPWSATVSLVTLSSGEREETAMTPEGGGYFVHRQSQVAEGLPYAFKLADGRDYPDPASRWQPDGVHRPSAVFSPELYGWSDAAWRGIAREELVIYELHVGTFTPEGTFDAIVPRLPELVSLGVTAIEVMPVAQFPGDRNWGYDGVYPYAVQNSYGGPRALQRLVDAAHQVGLAVFWTWSTTTSVPRGTTWPTSAPISPIVTTRPWGSAINYDGPESDAVRQFVIDNACMWVRDFHVDGLRLDAVQTIYDLSPQHILADIQAAVQREAAAAVGSSTSSPRATRTTCGWFGRPRSGGYGLDGVWSDDFHHSVHALLTGERDGYYLDFGEPSHVAKAINDVFVYDGCYSPFRRRRHGSRVGATDRTRFVVCIQNHDQVGNRARGDRLSTIVPPAADAWRAVAAALAVRAAVVHGRGIRREQGPFRSSARSRIRRSSRRCGAAGARSSPPLRFSGERRFPIRKPRRRSPRPSLPGHGRRARRRRNCGSSIKTCWRRGASGRPSRPAAHRCPAAGSASDCGECRGLYVAAARRRRTESWPWRTLPRETVVAARVGT